MVGALNSKPDGAGAAAKVRSLEELGGIAAELRARGDSIVLAHGVFDLLHIGHVRHLEAARREGAVLIVTVTADAFVIKGPGRPAFPAEIRAAMLAALGCVDYVGIHHGASAEEVIHLLKPAAYIKGSEYANPEDDITGKIVAEQAAVTRHGGRLVLTDEVTHSSSSLINRYLDIYDPPLREYLDSLRARELGPALAKALQSVENLRILIVGDAIIDEYAYVEPLGKSPKENMIATLLRSRESFAGGVFAAANHLASFCRGVELVTVLGTDDDAETLVRRSLKPNIVFTPIYRPGSPTTKKTRFVEPMYTRKLFEVYSMDDTPLAGDVEAALLRTVSEKAGRFDVVIVTDFGHGMITRRAIEALEQNARFLAVNTQTNSSNLGFNLITKFRRADYISIDAPEARLAAGDKFGELETSVVSRIRAQVQCDRLAITHGGHGCYAFDGTDRSFHIPAFTRKVVDTVGAGDAFFAVTAPLVAAGVSMELVGVIGNAAGAMKVGIVGHRSSIERIPLEKFLTTLVK